MLSLIKKIFSKKIYKSKKLNHKDTLSYIANYNYIIEDIKEVTSSKKSKYVWQYWAQGIDNAPPLVKKCMESVAHYCSEFEVIIINDSNIKEYVDIPKHIYDKLKQGKISYAHFSDYLRAYLLSKYGGIWIDATVLLTNNLPKEVLDSEFFQFKSSVWSLFSNVPSFDMLKIISSFPSYLSSWHSGSSWLLVGKKNNRVCLLLKKFIEEYWMNNDYLINYYLFHYALTYFVLNDNKCRKIYNNMVTLNNRNPHILQKVLFESFNVNIFSEIKNISSVHKLTYKNLQRNIYEDSFLNHILSLSIANIDSNRSLKNDNV